MLGALLHSGASTALLGPAPYHAHRMPVRVPSPVVAKMVGPNNEPFDVVIQKPLGLKLMEKDGIGVVVSMVYEDSNACDAGIRVGDIIIATSASIGPGMWPKKTLNGVEAAIQTRIDGQVRLRLLRPSADNRKLPWQGQLTNTYEVTLDQPLGLVCAAHRASPCARRALFLCVVFPHSPH